MNDPGDANNPLQGMLGDLLKLIGGAGGGHAPWIEAARSLAHGVATDGAPEANVDPIERMKLQELSRIAELYVTEATGSSGTSGEHPVKFDPVTRGTWALRALESWRPLIQKMVDAQEGTMPTGLDDLDPDRDDSFGLQNLLGRFASTLGPVMLGLQFGSAAGHLAQGALGQYAIAIPWSSDHHELLVVPQNVNAFASDWSLPEDATRLWVCVRELTIHSIITRPEISARITELLQGATQEVVAVQQGLAEKLGGTDTDPEKLQALFSDPEELLSDLLSPGQRATSDRLTAAVTVIGAYADHVTAGIAKSTIGSEGQLSEAWHRYRIDDTKGLAAAGSLLGIDLGREQVERGGAFVTGVIERAGEDGLNRLFTWAKNLPTPAEIDAPGLWLERIDLTEDLL